MDRPSFRDLPEVLEDDQDAALDLEQLQAHITELEARLAPFDSAAWVQAAAQVQGALNEQVALLSEAKVPLSGEQVLTCRGRMQALRYVLDLPTRLQNALDQANRMFEAAVAEQEAETEGEE